MAAVTPLNFQDIGRIVNAFDQDIFKTPPPKSASYARQMVVINQLERNLNDIFPVELIDQIVRSYIIESAPSVGALLMYYIGSPVIASKYDYPLSSNEMLLNGASKILLLRLGQKPSEEKEELASFKQLMTSVFKHYYQRLDSSQRLLLLQRCHITPWEQKSPEEKFQLLGRVQSLCGWTQPQIKLQFLSWKIRFAVAHVLKSNVLDFVFYGPIVIIEVMILIALVFSLFQGINSVTFGNNILEAFNMTIATILFKGVLIGIVGGMILSGCGSAIFLLFATFGTVLTFRHFPTYIQEKGTWIQSINWNCFQLFWNYFFLILSFFSFSKKNQCFDAEIRKNFNQALAELNKQLIETINEAKIPMEQEKFIEAQLPDLLEKWHLLISQITRIKRPII